MKRDLTDQFVRFAFAETLTFTKFDLSPFLLDK